MDRVVCHHLQAATSFGIGNVLRKSALLWLGDVDAPLNPGSTVLDDVWKACTDREKKVKGSMILIGTNGPALGTHHASVGRYIIVVEAGLHLQSQGHTWV